MEKSKKEIYKEYLANKVNPIFEKLIVDLLHTRPEDVLAFIKDWADDKGS